MNVALAASAANETGAGVQTAVIDSTGALVGLVSLLLAAAWVATLYR